MATTAAACSQIASFCTECAQEREKACEIQQQNASLVKRCALLQSHVMELEERVTEKDAETEHFHRSVHQVTAQNKQLVSSQKMIDELNQQIIALQEELEQQHSRVHTLQTHNSQLDTDNKQLQEALREIESRKESSKQRVGELYQAHVGRAKGLRRRRPLQNLTNFQSPSPVAKGSVLESPKQQQPHDALLTPSRPTTIMEGSVVRKFKQSIQQLMHSVAACSPTSAAAAMAAESSNRTLSLSEPRSPLACNLTPPARQVKATQARRHSSPLQIWAVLKQLREKNERLRAKLQDEKTKRMLAEQRCSSTKEQLQRNQQFLNSCRESEATLIRLEYEQRLEAAINQTNQLQTVNQRLEELLHQSQLPTETVSCSSVESMEEAITIPDIQTVSQPVSDRKTFTRRRIKMVAALFSFLVLVHRTLYRKPFSSRWWIYAVRILRQICDRLNKFPVHLNIQR